MCVSFLSWIQFLTNACYKSPSTLNCRCISRVTGVNIYQELFSKGQSSAPGIFQGLSSYSSCTSQSGFDTMMPPLQRRKISVLKNGGPLSSMVNGLLLQMGMPMSIRQLVCDLLTAIDESCHDSAFSSLEEVLWDLSQMRTDPQHYLFDRLCPQKALDDMGLLHSVDRQIFGREKELDTLMEAKKNTANHVLKKMDEDGEPETITSSQHGVGGASFGQKIDFQCETIFLSGYAGAGKSMLLMSLMHACSGWFVLSCKFNKEDAPHKVLANAIDRFFAKWTSKYVSVDRSNLDEAMMESFRQVCHSISSTIDKEGLSQLCEIIPNMSKVFPGVAKAGTSHNHDQGASSIDQVGYGTVRHMNLFHVIFKSLCSVGRPVLLLYDDLQWADSMKGLKDFVTNYINIPFAANKGACHHGLLIVGAFRSNEVESDDGIIKTIAAIEQSRSANVTVLSIGEMAQGDIMALLSAKLCLPLRHTKQLSALVLSKTRGNPFFIVQFLKSIGKLYLSSVFDIAETLGGT